MKKRVIETAGDKLEVSELVIGSAVKMRSLTQQELFAVYDRYLESGGNCIDTARAYDGGRTEEIIGQYLCCEKRREQVILSTKCGHPDPDGRPRLDYRHLKEDVEQSLKALRTDYIDILWLHKDDDRCRAEKIIDDLNRVIREGKVRMIGCSNWHIDRLEAANKYAEATGQRGFAASQIQWSLARSQEKFFRQYGAVLMDKASYDWYLSKKMPVFAYSPQAQGFFSKMASGGEDSLNKMLATCYLNHENRVRFQRVKTLAEDRGVPVSVPVLAYLLHNRVTCFPVFGATSMTMLEETLTAVDFEMTEEEAEELILL